jgi:transposase
MAGSMPSLCTPKRFLSAEQKYEIWLTVLTGELTTNQAATRAGVDRSTIMTLRKVARDGAIAALQVSASCDVRTRIKGAEEAVARSRRFQRALKERQPHEAG